MKKKLFFTLSILFFLFSSQVYSDESPYVDFYTSKNYLSHINKGYMFLDMKNYPLALKEFNTAQYLDPKIASSYECLGNVYEITKNPKEAMENYQKSLDLLSPKHSLDILKKIKKARETDDTKVALSLYKYILSIRPEAGLQIMFGDKSINERNYEKALVYYKRAYELQENPDKYLKIVQVKDSNKEYERYIVRKYLKNNLKYPTAHYKAGLIYFGNAQYFNASQEFKKTVEQNNIPEIENDYIYYLAMSYYKYAINSKKNTTNTSEYLDNSIELFKKHLKNTPNDKKAKFSLAESYFYKDISKMSFYDKEIFDAEKEFSKVISLPEKDPEYIDLKKILDSLLEKKYAQNMFDKSLDILLEIKASNNPDPGVYYSIGNVYFKKGFGFQKGFYEKRKYMDAQKTSARDSAWNFYQKSINEYRTYIQKNKKNDSIVYYDLGLVYYNASKLEPNPSYLPITSETKSSYQQLGVRFYKRDMINRAIDNFNVYLRNNSLKQNEVLRIISELKQEYNKKI